jgi:hypothetical protein
MHRDSVRMKAALMVAGLTLAACAERADSAAGEPRARDSAGVRIVQSAAEAEVPVWRIAAEPLVEVGGPEAAFAMVSSALRTADGFVVADATSGELRYFDAQGRQARRVGRRGRGPGEFQYVGWIGTLRGDSLAAWDPLLRRFSVFAPDGAPARDFSPAGVSGFFPSVHGVFADGSLLISTGMESGSTPAAAQPWRDTMVLLRIGRAGELKDTVARVPGPSRYAATSSTGMQQTHSVPFGPTTSVVAHGDEVYVATGERYEIAIHGGDGRLRRVIRNAAPGMPVTRRERESYAANTLQSGGTPEEQRARQELIRTAPFPCTMAPIETLRVDDAGNTWVREAQSPDTWNRFTRWSVFGPDGRRIASVEAPGRFVPDQFGPDWVLAHTLDPDGTPRVRLYRLQR